jgi:hypothetical protein
MSNLRIAILVVCVGGSLFMLQGAFDASDHRKAERAMQVYLVNGKSLAAFVEERAPGGRWSTEITQSCRGVVRTRYAARSGSYEFDYEVPSHAIHPGNDLGRAALEAFAASGGRPDGGVAK